jgi:hypothetical protein
MTVNQTLIDFFVVLFSLVFNMSMILVFVLRGQKRSQLEANLGPVTNALLIPFSVLWTLNVLNGSGVGRLITSLPIIIFLAFDLWYRTITKKKPYHHPEKWPRSLAVYVILYQVGAIMLNGYAFMVSRLVGNIVLASYFGSLLAYGYYQYRYNKK